MIPTFPVDLSNCLKQHGEEVVSASSWRVQEDLLEEMPF